MRATVTGEMSAAVAGVCFGLAFVGAALLHAADADFDGRMTTKTALETRVAAGDLVFRDPRTGHPVTATAERVTAIRNELAPQFLRSTVAPETTRADGTVVAQAGATIRDVTVIRVNLDGTRETACVRNLDEAVAFVVGITHPNPVRSTARSQPVDE